MEKSKKAGVKEMDIRDLEEKALDIISSSKTRAGAYPRLKKLLAGRSACVFSPQVWSAYDALTSGKTPTIVVVSQEYAIPGKFFEELEVQKDAEVGCGFHGTYTLKNVKIKKVLSNFNAVGAGSMRVSRVIVKELEN